VLSIFDSNSGDFMKVFIKLSDKTGNPEVWAYRENAADCDLVFGSLVTGGLQNKGQSSGYGRNKEKQKLRDGYEEVPAIAGLGPYVESDIGDAKYLVRYLRNNAGGPPPDIGNRSKRSWRIVKAAFEAASSTWSLPAWFSGIISQMRDDRGAPVSPGVPAPPHQRLEIGFIKTEDPWSW
jgi:hypothetical protein